ncbi:MAG: Unknown protein [uncultured Sulfurovum sp.]|uniref:Aminotransferase class I/classII large domain-containing protein n=1 Tax=uncultured Sulfurovum sp. TaxID=269237 RepID=A0A6S6TYV9_9BACT|nr:MAG: Unknown protein [uncultured Sulfurovum sp.]
MNFKAYKLWQKEYLQNNPDVFRADCLNPFISMKYLIEDVEYKSQDISQLTLYRKWKMVEGIEIPSENLVLTRGVRHSLSKLFNLFSAETIYVPEDVYPRYFELAKKNRVKTFVTYPRVDWKTLEKVDNAVVLLTIPFTPMGKVLDDEIISKIQGLLKHNNKVIIDSVYDYNLRENFQKLEVLFNAGTVFWLHSLSKTYLSPEVLGIVYCSFPTYPSYLEEAFDNYEIKDEVSYNNAYDILDQVPNFPNLQQKEFHKGFKHLTAETDLDVSKSKIAYFSVIEAPFEDLLKHNILGIPASAFGSQNKNLTIVSALFYLNDLV